MRKRKNKGTSFNYRKNKDNYYRSEYKTLKDYLRDHTATRYMAAIILDIPIQNVCSYVDMMRDNYSVAVVKTNSCKITGWDAEYLTTNPAKFPIDNQLKMF